MTSPGPTGAGGSAVARTVLDGEDDVRSAIGSELGISEWLEITQQHLDDFVAATGDPQRTYLAVSLSNLFLPQIVEVRGYALGVNYGTEAVQVGTPLRAGQRVRGRAELTNVTDVRGGIQTTMLVSIERDASSGNDDVCVIEALSRWMNP